MNYGARRSDYMRQHAEWAMSPREFDRDWPAATQDGNIWYFGPKGKGHGYGSALTQEAAEWGRHRVFETSVNHQLPIWC